MTTPFGTLRCIGLAAGVLFMPLHASAAEGPDPFQQVGPSIARVNFSDFRTTGYCTAVQAGRRAALLVAPCLHVASFDRLHFLFGYDRGQWAAHRIAVTAYNDPKHPDLKLVCLSEALPESRFGATSQYTDQGPAFAPAERVVVASYTAPKSHRVTFQGCSLASVSEAGMAVLKCIGNVDGAGAPVFTLIGGQANLRGLVAGTNDSGLVASSWTGAPPDTLCPPEQQPSKGRTHG